MSDRSRLLYEISQALQLHPPVSSVAMLKERVELPSKFQSLKTLDNLQSLLDWINDGKPEIKEDPKPAPKYRRKLSEDDRREILRLVSEQVKPNYAAIGRRFDVTGQTVRNVCK